MDNDDTNTQEDNPNYLNGQKALFKDISGGSPALNEGLGQGTQGSQYIEARNDVMESPDGASKIVISF